MICLKTKTIFALIACALLCSCSGYNSVSTQTETTSVGTQTSLFTSAETNPTVEIPTDNAPYVDEKGLLTDSGKRRIAELSNNAYTGLFNFDGDGVPEVYTVPEENSIANKCLVCKISGEKITVSDIYDGIYIPSAKS